MKRSSNHGHIMFRYVLISLGILLFASVITYKMFSTTIINADKWNEKAMSELQRTSIIVPQRGEILASDGTVLVTNLVYYDVHIDFKSDAFSDTEFLKNINPLCDSLAKYHPVHNREGWHTALMDQFNRPDSIKSRYYRLLKRINHEELERLKTFPFFNLNNSFKTGLTANSYMKRDYPYGSMARRSIGRVGQTNTCSEIHGISGLEKALDSLLYGQPGIYKYVPLTSGIGEWTDVPAVDGYNVVTTIDINLQDLLEQELNTILDSCQAEWGTAILMEVATGDIKAISNLERDKKTGEYIEAFNRAVVAYEPGSVVKPISMMFALENGLVNNLNEVIPIGNSFAYAGGRPITDSHFNSSLTVAGVIEESSNIGMTRITIRGFNDRPKDFVKCFEDIGFMEHMNSGIAEEERPRIIRNPSRVDMSRMCYGYATAIPPLYTLSVYNAIANDGKYVRPRLVKGLSRNGVDSVLPVTYIRDSICSRQNADKLRQMLTRVVEGKHGTGRRLKNEYVRIAGKTGTCYDIDKATGTYDRSKKRLAFCGFFPADNPKYSCMVLTFHPTRNMFGAPSTSGEVLKNVALKMYSRGLLGDHSDYRKNPPANPDPLVLHAGDNDNQGKLIDALSKDTKVSRLKYPEGMTNDNVPFVKNLTLRDAIVRLEQHNYNVKFTGSGRVTSQTLVGDTVYLSLSMI